MFNVNHKFTKRMKYKLITLIFVCTFALQCSAQWHIIMSIKCQLYNNYNLSKAILEVCGEDFVNDALLMQGNCVSAFVYHDSLGNVDDIRIITNRIQIDDDDLIHIKQYIISNNMKFASCPYREDYFERSDGIRHICSERGRALYKRKNGLYESLVSFPGCPNSYTLFHECDSSEMLARYLEWMEGNSYPNCLPMCEPCGCDTMNEMSNDYIFQQLEIGDMMTYQLLNEYVHQTEEVKQKFLFELSHPLHAKVDVIEKCAKNIAESLVLSDYEKERMLKALKK